MAALCAAAAPALPAANPSATSPAIYEPVGVNAGDAEWLDTLTAPTAEGQDGQVVPLDPTSPVLPSGGDLQVLTITQGGGAADDVATSANIPKPPSRKSCTNGSPKPE